MAASKNILRASFTEKLIFIYLAAFPLGQLLRFNFKFLTFNIPFHLVDLLAAVALLFLFFGKVKVPKIFKFISAFLLVCVFSLLLSLTKFNSLQVFVGTLYLLRFVAYSALFVAAWNIRLKNAMVKNTLFNSLITISFATGIFGWIQYFWLSDLRALKFLGWDDHLYRLVGTFLDPGFTGIILVLGFLAVFTRFIDTGDKLLTPILGFFLVTIAFTYARASYLALFAGVVALALLKKKMKKVFWPIFLLLILIPLLPRPPGEGVKLERLHSVYAKAQNFSETTTIISKNPLFGVGFNNICAARIKYIGDAGYSHACSGSDSSLLFVAATTGLVGLLIFLYMAYKIIKSISRNVYGVSFLVCSGALFVHSLFVHSLFYPWVMGWMGILLAISLKAD